jgi:hypothetical protein
VNEEVGGRVYDEVFEVVVLLRQLLVDGLLPRDPDGAAEHRARAEAQVAHAEGSHLLMQRAVRSTRELSTRREHGCGRRPVTGRRSTLLWPARRLHCSSQRPTAAAPMFLFCCFWCLACAAACPAAAVPSISSSQTSADAPRFFASLLSLVRANTTATHRVRLSSGSLRVRPMRRCYAIPW